MDRPVPHFGVHGDRFDWQRGRVVYRDGFAAGQLLEIRFTLTQQNGSTVNGSIELGDVVGTVAGTVDRLSSLHRCRFGVGCGQQCHSQREHRHAGSAGIEHATGRKFYLDRNRLWTYRTRLQRARSRRRRTDEQPYVPAGDGPARARLSAVGLPRHAPVAMTRFTWMVSRSVSRGR